jgi:hypothetical protein
VLTNEIKQLTSTKHYVALELSNGVTLNIDCWKNGTLRFSLSGVVPTTAVRVCGGDSSTLNNNILEWDYVKH